MHTDGNNVTTMRRIALLAVAAFSLAAPLLPRAVEAQVLNAESVVPPIVQPSVVPSIQSAAPVVAPPASVLGSQITTAAPTTIPTTIATEVKGNTIVAPAVSGVAFTGSDVAGPVRLALTLGLAGCGLVLIARRRRRPTA